MTIIQLEKDLEEQRNKFEQLQTDSTNLKQNSKEKKKNNFLVKSNLLLIQSKRTERRRTSYSSDSRSDGADCRSKVAFFFQFLSISFDFCFQSRIIWLQVTCSRARTNYNLTTKRFIGYDSEIIRYSGRIKRKAKANSRKKSNDDQRTE